MKKPLKPKRPATNPLPALLAGLATLLLFVTANPALGYERYNDGCMECHGHFTSAVSTKGSIFPEDNKHEMHRKSTYMNSDCDLCHTNGDNRNPYTGSSNGTAANAGLGCTGCHVAVGLRAHHAANNVEDSAGDTCYDCHTDPAPAPENVKPPYYGTVDTKADNPCNDSMLPDTDENWTVGDLVGLDNDGDELYDLADFDCGPPYRIVAIEFEGNDVRITWESVGGRRDILQSSPDLSTPFTDVGSAVVIPGVGVQTTNVVETGAATQLRRFYRIRYAGPSP